MSAPCPRPSTIAATPRVAADAAERRLVKAVTMETLFYRVDPTHELPIVVETESGLVIARLRRDGDAAYFCAPHAGKSQSIPAAIADQLDAAGLR